MVLSYNLKKIDFERIKAMKNIFVSGLVNTETTVRIDRFPIEYCPIDYPFFGVNTAVSGVGFNIAKALKTLGSEVRLASMTGKDFAGEYIKSVLEESGISTVYLKPALKETPSSVILYDDEGKRRIYCDLKDIQETEYGFSENVCAEADVVIACNANFSRPLLSIAKQKGKIIATDVHVLTNIEDVYNGDFIRQADILFLSDEGIGENFREFLLKLAQSCQARVIVIGRGHRGAAVYLRDDNKTYSLAAAHVGNVINTAGAGDALFSAFVHFFAGGSSPVEALIRAEIFAAAKIRSKGASKGFVTENELETLYQIHSPQIKNSIEILK